MRVRIAQECGTLSLLSSSKSRDGTHPHYSPERRAAGRLTVEAPLTSRYGDTLHASTRTRPSRSARSTTVPRTKARLSAPRGRTRGHRSPLQARAERVSDGPTLGLGPASMARSREHRRQIRCRFRPERPRRGAGRFRRSTRRPTHADLSAGSAPASGGDRARLGPSRAHITCAAAFEHWVHRLLEGRRGAAGRDAGSSDPETHIRPAPVAS